MRSSNRDVPPESPLLVLESVFSASALEPRWLRASAQWNPLRAVRSLCPKEWKSQALQKNPRSRSHRAIGKRPAARRPVAVCAALRPPARQAACLTPASSASLDHSKVVTRPPRAPASVPLHRRPRTAWFSLEDRLDSLQLVALALGAPLLRSAAAILPRASRASAGWESRPKQLPRR